MKEKNKKQKSLNSKTPLKRSKKAVLPVSHKKKKKTKHIKNYKKINKKEK